MSDGADLFSPWADQAALLTCSSRCGSVGSQEVSAEGGLLNLPWGMAHIDDQSIDKRRIQIKGFWSAIEGVDQSGSMGYMPNRSQICLDFVIYQDKNTVSQKTCHTAKCFQRMGFLSSCGVTAFSSIETFIAHLFCAFF